VWAIKGVAGQGRLVWPRKPSRAGKLRVDLFPIGVDTIKDVLYGRLKRVNEPGPGYVHLDATADDATADQIASETMVYRVVQGRRVRAWKPRSSGIRNEQLDTFIYAYAAMIGRGGAAVVDRRQTIPVEDALPEVPEVPLLGSVAERIRKPFPSPVRRGWVGSWKK